MWQKRVPCHIHDFVDAIVVEPTILFYCHCCCCYHWYYFIFLFFSPHASQSVNSLFLLLRINLFPQHKMSEYIHIRSHIQSINGITISCGCNKMVTCLHCYSECSCVCAYDNDNAWQNHLMFMNIYLVSKNSIQKVWYVYLAHHTHTNSVESRYNHNVALQFRFCFQIWFELKANSLLLLLLLFVCHRELKLKTNKGNKSKESDYVHVFVCVLSKKELERKGEGDIVGDSEKEK